MKFSLFVALSIATVAFAASITPAGIAAENVRTVDAATYKAFANGTLSPADLPPVGVIRILVESRFPVTDRVTIASGSPKARRRKRVSTLSRQPANYFDSHFLRYLCTAANWQLYCVYITDAGPGECVELAGDLDNQVSSVGPDPNQTCVFYK
jgi:hypothetical protein